MVFCLLLLLASHVDPRAFAQAAGAGHVSLDNAARRAALIPGASSVPMLNDIDRLLPITIRGAEVCDIDATVSGLPASVFHHQDQTRGNDDGAETAISSYASRLGITTSARPPNAVDDAEVT